MSNGKGLPAFARSDDRDAAVQVHIWLAGSEECIFVGTDAEAMAAAPSMLVVKDCTYKELLQCLEISHNTRDSGNPFFWEPSGLRSV